MLISKVSDETGCAERRAAAEGGDHEPEYQTANELFELMSKTAHYDSNDEDSLTAQELVLLYKNIDIGTKLMNDSTVLTHKKPNQYVETVVYNDDVESESDASEMYSVDDLQNVFMANQERIDFFNDKSLENLLCPKFGGIQINSSDLPTDYDKNFLFKDPYIKNQLINPNCMSSSEFDGLFSTSLIDYICCKRLEDNYNFYMDNIIKYVQHTIEQLKRISNGDYLTDRAKEKWREMNSNNQEQENNTKVLATSTSIPLHVECKQAGIVSWDDIVHSEVDIRSLSKILEKKIVVEIPKLICGSYRLYSRQCSDNLIISCQKEQHDNEHNGQEPRVDVILQLQRSQTGQVMSNINSIMILRTSPALPDLLAKEILPLPYKAENDELRSIKEDESKETKVTIIELSKNSDVPVTQLETECSNIKEISQQENEDYLGSQNESSIVESNDYPSSDRNISCEFASNQQSSESSLALRESLDKPFFPLNSNELSYNIISTDELRVSMQRLHKETSVLEESSEELNTCTASKRRSPIRVRIKSPYENKSFLMEEKKRKRLLEIRERREKKKMALSENCKISKHKYGKGAITPHASSSVTKLSISNKSFYNSIYGQSINVEDKFKTGQFQKNSALTPETSPKDKQNSESPILTLKKNSKKYINRSYYLDDAETEMMHMQTKLENETKNETTICSDSNSFVSNEFHATFDLLKQLIEPTDTNLDSNQTCHIEPNNFDEVPNSSEYSLVDITVPANIDNEPKINSKKKSTSYECRKSIDQLYDLIKKFEKPNGPEIVKVVPKIDASYEVRSDTAIQGSESSTSVKHVTESNHSCCSAEKCNTTSTKFKTNKKQVAIMPKVIISSKLQSPKKELDKTEKERKSILTPQYKGPPSDNPLKAISQLLHKFENVQKIRQKPASEAKPPKKPEVMLNDLKSNFRQSSYKRRSRLEQHLKGYEQEKKSSPVLHTTTTPKEKNRAKPTTPMELVRNHPNPVEDRNVDKLPKKKITDIIDEAKEARGEAVRGPSKFSSRLNSLAQPKKSYVMAHHEEYQNRYGKNFLAERLQRLAEAPAPAPDRSMMAPAARNRRRRNGTDVISVASVKLPPSSAPHLDKGDRGARRSLRSSSSSPVSMARQPTVTHKPSHLHQLYSQEEIDSKNMVTIESYVKRSYSRKSPSPSGSALLAGLRSRIPLLPRDIDLGSSPSSCVEACELGAALHRLVEAAVSGAPAAALAALAECAESAAGDEPRRARSDSDEGPAPDDSPPTAVEAVRSASSSRDVLGVLESALYTQISGAFPKRLRIENLTLTPKHSMQQMFFLQSGDASSALVKSAVSRLKLNGCGAESLHELKAMPVLSNSNLDWTFARFPKQIATVGYVFPEYREFRNASTSNVKILEIPTIVDSGSGCREFSSQCFKGSPERSRVESAAQVDIVDDVTAATVAISVENFSSQVTNSPLPVETEHIEIYNANRTDSLEAVDEVECIDDIVGDDAAVEEETVPIEDINDVKEEEMEGTSKSSVPAPAADYTSSLDMLVGILNEIQKITCQDEMASRSNDQDCADFETNPNDIDLKEDSTRDLISITSLENMRQLESTASVNSFNLSTDSNTSEVKVEPVLNEEIEFVDKSTDAQLRNDVSVGQQSVNENVTEVTKLAGVDKEASANIVGENCVDTCTDVPSSLLHIVVDTSTNVSDCALRSVSESSPLSILPVADQSLCSITSPSIKKIIELSQIEVKQKRVSIPRDKTVLNEKRFAYSSIQNVGVKTERNLVRSELQKYCVKNIDLDPMLKIKRDVLVTVYSILVLTVFAALSFPELLMFQS